MSDLPETTVAPAAAAGTRAPPAVVESRVARAAAVCPFLGIAEDDRTHFAYPTLDHRCFSRRNKPMTVDAAYQSSFCMSTAHIRCARYLDADHAPERSRPATSTTAEHARDVRIADPRLRRAGNESQGPDGRGRGRSPADAHPSMPAAPPRRRVHRSLHAGARRAQRAFARRSGTPPLSLGIRRLGASMPLPHRYVVFVASLVATAVLLLVIALGDPSQSPAPALAEPGSPRTTAPVAAVPTVDVTAAPPTERTPTVTNPRTVRPAAPPASAAPSGSLRPDASRPPAGILLEETFDDQPMGALTRPGWTVTPSPETLTIAAVPTSVDRSARIEAPRSGEPARACLLLPELPERFAVEVEFRLEGLRSPGTQLAVDTAAGRVRIQVREQVLVVGDGGTFVATDIVVEPEVWYRVTIDADTSVGTYSVSVDRPGRSGTSQAPEVRLHTVVRSTQQLCFTTRSVTTASMAIDEITIRSR